MILNLGHTIVPRADSATIRSALERAAVGDLDVDSATALLSANGGDLDDLLELASNVRDEGLRQSGRGKVISYSRKVFIPLTTLCRDRCHYCVFVDTPGGLERNGKDAFMHPDEVIEIARAGADLGCKEALFTLGDRPEGRWRVAREWLSAHGYSSTLDYLADVANRVRAETGLLPHLNPGVMTWLELQRLRPLAPSMGMMLETTSHRLWAERGGAHFGSPDKDPALRLQVLEDAGRSRIPFTTGILLGIGETLRDRAEALFAIRESHQRWGHIQETIVQNFRAKPRTAMQDSPDLGTDGYIAAVAVARLVMGPEAHIQAPPNLTDPAELHKLIRAGIDDWGGVSPLTPDHVNPERPWPHLDDLAHLTAEHGFTLHERLTVHPEWVDADAGWIDRNLRNAVGQHAATYAGHPATSTPRKIHHRTDAGALLARAEAKPAGLSRGDYAALLELRGSALDALAELADTVRIERLGDTITYAVNQNLDSSKFHPDGPLDLEAVREIAAEASAGGATEICIQGRVPTTVSADQYLELIRAIADAAPDLHVHAYRPAEIADAAARLNISVLEALHRLRRAGVGSVPGTGALILDEEARAGLPGGRDITADAWMDLVSTAHRAGLPTTATLVYGHGEHPSAVVQHLDILRDMQDSTGGFSEFIPMPFMPGDQSNRISSPSASLAYSRAVHAVARLQLSGRIDHVQAAWTKLGLSGAEVMLQSGADDLGGVLLPSTAHPDSGAEAGRTLHWHDVRDLASHLERIPQQRTTLYTPIERTLPEVSAPSAPRVTDHTRSLIPQEHR